MRKALTTNKICSSLFLSFVCFTASGFADASPEVKSDDLAPRHMRAGVRHIEGKGIGYRKGYTTVEGFFAADPSTMCVMPFLDLRGHVFNDGKLASNAGLGIRSLLGCRIYGLNAYYDYRKTRRQHYNQVGAGLETLGTLWDFRINGYLPVGKKKSQAFDFGFEEFSGHQAIVSRKFEYAFKEANAEVGFHIWRNKNFDFYGAAGPYYLAGSYAHAWGGKARLMGTLYEYVTLEVSDSYDSIFHNIVQGEIGIRIPFGPRSTVKRSKSSCFNSSSFPTAITQRMVDPVFRQEIIPVKNHTQKTAAINPETGLPYFFVFVDNTSSSLGTFESPYPTLVQAQDNSKPNDVIYVFPGNNTTSGMDDGIIMQDNQRLWGSSIAHQLPTTLGTITINPLSSVMPSITSTADVITLANNNEVAGFYIANPSGNGITGPSGIINFTGVNNIVDGSGADYAFNMNNASGTILIADNTIIEQLRGVNIVSTLQENPTFSIANNQISLTNGEGLNATFTSNNGATLNISGNTISAALDAMAIDVNDMATGLDSKTINITGNTMRTGTNNMTIGLTNNAAVHMTVASNQGISNSDSNFSLTAGQSTLPSFSITDNTFASNNNSIDIFLTDNSVGGGTIANNSLAANTSSAIRTQALVSGIFTGRIANNQIASITSDGIEIAGSTNSRTTVDILNNNITTGGTGVFANMINGSFARAMISGNNFLANQAGGVTLQTSDASEGIWDVIGNTFVATSPASEVTSNQTSHTCLTFLSNTASPFGGAFTFTQTGTSEFELEPLSGNSGQVVEVGTITHVPAGTCNATSTGI